MGGGTTRGERAEEGVGLEDVPGPSAPRGACTVPPCDAIQAVRIVYAEKNWSYRLYRTPPAKRET